MFYRRTGRTGGCRLVGDLGGPVVVPDLSPGKERGTEHSDACVMSSLIEQKLPRAIVPASECILTNARVVVADSVIVGTVRITDGRITDISTGRTDLSAALDLQGDYLLPGLVDVHTDNLERHLQPRPGVVWPGVQALLAHDHQLAAAGITTALDSLCVGDRDSGRAGRPEVLIDSLDAIEQLQADNLLKTEHLLHLRCEVSAEGGEELLGRVIDHPLVRLVSLMDHTPGQRQWADLSKWRRHQSRNRYSDGELEVIYRHRAAQGAELATNARMFVAEMCRRRRLSLASHDDATIEHVLEAAELGVTISEFPTTAAAARAARAQGMRIVMGAPNVVLNGSHSGNVSARELVAAGLVDGLASDYVPMSLIQACFALHYVLGLSLPRAAAVVSAKPAAMVGLDDRGVIAPGRRADLVWVRSYGEMPIVRGVWREGERVV